MSKARAVRPVAFTLACLLAVPLLTYGFYVQDAVIQLSEPSGFFLGENVPAERLSLWEDPPSGAGTRPFRWGLSEPMELRPSVPLDLAKWEPVYRQLDPDLVRVFLWWDGVEPRPGEYDGRARSQEIMRFVADGGWDSYGVFFQAPYWASPGGAVRKLLGPRIWRYDPPRAFGDPDGPFGRYIELVARHWPGIAVWQIWNEPDYPNGQVGAQRNPLFYRSWRGTAAQYGRLLRAGTDKVNEVAPQGLVAASAGHPRYAEAALAVSGTQGIDLYDMHFPAGRGRPDVDAVLDRMIALVKHQKDAATAAGADAPGFSISELSYPYTEAGARDHADFVTKSHAIGAALGWDMLVWWEVGPSDPAYYVDSGLVESDGSLRPGGEAWMFSKTVLSGRRGLGLRGDGDDVRIAAFAGPDGRAAGETWVAWTVTGEGSITWPPEAPPARVHDTLGNMIGTIQPGETVDLVREARYFVPES